MCDKNNIEDIINTIKKSIKSKNAKQLADGIISIIKVKPNNWQSYMFFAGFLSSPNRTVIHEELSLILESFQIIIESGIGDSESIVTFLTDFLTFNQLFESIKKEKKTIKFFQESYATQTFVIAYFLESQIKVAFDSVNKKVKNDGFFSDTTLSESTLPLAYSSGKVGLQQGVEINCEIVELMLREILHGVSKKKEYGEIKNSIKAYESKDFLHNFILASHWFKISDLWANFKYERWSLKRDKPDKKYIYFVPKDKDKLINKEVSRTRYNRIIHSLSSIYIPYLIDKVSDTPQRIINLKKSIDLPVPYENWEGKIDLRLLKKTSERTLVEIFTGLIVEERYYKQLLPKEIKEGSYSTTWNSWLKVLSSLRVLSDALELATNDNKIKDAESLIIRISKEKLLNILESSTNLEKKDVKASIELLIFSPKRKKMEIWDQPLIPISNTDVLILPRLVKMGSAIRAIENMALQYGTANFGSRGNDFEKRIAEIWGEIEHSHVIHGFNFKLNKKEKIEFDIIIIWDKNIILCEVKCLKSVHSVADEKRAKEEVDYSIKQLLIRKKTVLDNWDSFCNNKAFSEVNLPVEVPKENEIFCISINNLTEFTGMFFDDIVVLDDVTLARFFQSPEVEALDISNGESIELMKIRGEINLDNFIAYTQNLPQIKEVKDRVKVKLAHLNPLTEKEPTLIYPYTELSPSKLELDSFQKLKLQNSVKSKKIGRNNLCPCGSGKKYKHCCIRG